jgi:hypothetical protein
MMPAIVCCPRFENYNYILSARIDRPSERALQADGNHGFAPF